jgi:hypothetical protein
VKKNDLVRVRDDAVVGSEYAKLNYVTVAVHGWLWRVVEHPELNEDNELMAGCTSLATGHTLGWLDCELEIINEEG